MRASRSSRNCPGHFRGQVAIGAGYELKITVRVSIRANGQKAFFFDSPQKHGLFVGAKLADFVEEKHAAVGRPQQAGPIGRGAGERAFHVAEQSRHRLVAADGCAIDLDELAGDLLPLPLQFVDAPCQLRLSGARRTGEQQRGPAGDHYALDAVDQAVELGVAGVDTGLQKRRSLFLVQGESGRETIVFRQVQVDDPIGTDRVLLMSPGGGRALEQFAGQVTRFRQQE